MEYVHLAEEAEEQFEDQYMYLQELIKQQFRHRVQQIEEDNVEEQTYQEGTQTRHSAEANVRIRNSGADKESSASTREEAGRALKAESNTKKQVAEQPSNQDRPTEETSKDNEVNTKTNQSRNGVLTVRILEQVDAVSCEKKR